MKKNDMLINIDPVPIDDWLMYHCSSGEVHCGTVVKRDIYYNGISNNSEEVKWWE